MPQMSSLDMNWKIRDVLFLCGGCMQVSGLKMLSFVYFIGLNIVSGGNDQGHGSSQIRIVSSLSFETRVAEQ